MPRARAAIGQLTYIAGREIVRDVGAQAAEGVQAVVMEFVRGFEEAVRNRPTRMQKLWDELGKIGQEALLASYDSHHGHSIEYRYSDEGKWRRFSNHALGDALASPELFKASPSGLDFIFKSFLDEVAPQWYRLNFGAAPRSHRQHSPPTMQFLGGSILPGLRLDGEPSAPFSIPPGFFLGQGYPSTPKNLRNVHSVESGGAFYPRALLGFGRRRNTTQYLASHGGINRRKPTQTETGWARTTRGIEGSGYINDGIDAMSAALPVLLNQLFNEWAAEALEGAYSVTGRQLRPSGTGYLANVAVADSPAFQRLLGDSIATIRSEPTLSGRFGAGRSFQARPL